MFLKKYLLASVLACLTLPVWAVITPEYKEITLSINTNMMVQKIDQPLQTFIQQVWVESPAMQGAQAAIEAARARAEGAGRPLYNPDLELAATALMGEVWQAAIAWLAASGQVEQWLGLSNQSAKTNSGKTT